MTAPLTYLFVELVALRLAVGYTVLAEVGVSVVTSIGNGHLVTASDVRSQAQLKS